jgi:hypothetical protein
LAPGAIGACGFWLPPLAAIIDNGSASLVLRDRQGGARVQLVAEWKRFTEHHYRRA